jgi:4a-hydroxytetrahydrobiopterin dehydratase
VQEISQLPGVEEHKPDVDLRHDGVTVRLITYTTTTTG